MQESVRSLHGAWEGIAAQRARGGGGHELQPLYFGATEVRMTVVGTDPVISFSSPSMV